MISLNASENTPTQSPSKLAKVLGALACTACVGAAAVWGLSQTSSSSTTNAQLVNVPDTFSGDFKVEGTYDSAYKGEGFFTKTNDADGNWVLEGQLNGVWEKEHSTADVTWYLKDSTMYALSKNETLGCVNRKPGYEAWKYQLASGVAVQLADLSGDVVVRAEKDSVCKGNDPVVFNSGDFGKIVLCADGSQTMSAGTATMYAQSWTGTITTTEVAREVVLPENELECAPFDPSLTSDQRQAKKYEEKGQKRALNEDTSGWPFSSEERALRGFAQTGGGPPQCNRACQSQKDLNNSKLGPNKSLWYLRWPLARSSQRWCFFIHGAGVDKKPGVNAPRSDMMFHTYWGGMMRTLTAGVIGGGFYKGSLSRSACNRWSFSNQDTRIRTWKDYWVKQEVAKQICGSTYCYTERLAHIFTHSMGGMIVCAAMRGRFFKLRGSSSMNLSNPPLLGSRAGDYVPYICGGGDAHWFNIFSGGTFEKAVDMIIKRTISKRNWCIGSKAKPVYYALTRFLDTNGYQGWLRNAPGTSNYCRHAWWSSSSSESCIFTAHRYCGGDPDGWDWRDVESQNLGKLSIRACYTSGFCLQRRCMKYETYNCSCGWRGCNKCSSSECKEKNYDNEHDGMVSELSCDVGSDRVDAYGRRPKIVYEETNHADGTGRTGDSYSANLRPNAWFEQIATGKQYCASRLAYCRSYYNFWMNSNSIKVPSNE